MSYVNLYFFLSFIPFWKCEFKTEINRILDFDTLRKDKHLYKTEKE